MSTATLHSEKKKALVPILRFQEFEEEWNEMKLGEFCEIVGGGTPDTNIPEYWGGEIQWFTPTEIKSDFVSNSMRTITELGLQKSSAKKLPIGTILLTTRATIGEVSIAREECSTNQGFQSLIARKGNSNIFIFNWIKQNKHELTSRANGSTFPEISKTAIEKIFLNAPSLPEQQKIASFLSAVDEKILQFSCKKELLSQYKKGVMQQLFSGKLRFKDENGKDYANWEEKKLGDVAEVKRGAASQHLNYVSDETKGIRLLRINDFLSNDAVYVENTVDMKRFTVQTNDILIAGTGATAGIIFIVPEKFNNLSFSYNAPRIRVKNAYHSFIYHYLKSGIILKQQQRLFVGNAQPFLDTDAMRGFKIKLPSNKEQQKIANFLSSIDTKIESTSQQINQTQSFKKGLLQQLFV